MALTDWQHNGGGAQCNAEETRSQFQCSNNFEALETWLLNPCRTAET